MNHFLVKQVIGDCPGFIYLHILRFYYWFHYILFQCDQHTIICMVSSFHTSWYLFYETTCDRSRLTQWALVLSASVPHGYELGLTGPWCCSVSTSLSISCLVLPLLEEGVGFAVVFIGYVFILSIKNRFWWHFGASWYKSTFVKARFPEDSCSTQSLPASFASQSPP